MSVDSFGFVKDVRYVGLDVSITSTGIAVLDYDEDGKERIKTYSVGSGARKGISDLCRFNDIIYVVTSIIHPNDFVLFEDYAYAASGQITRIAELTGQIKREIYILNKRSDARIFTCSPSTLKKYVTGKGNAKKDVMLKAVYQKWRFDTDSDDKADSFALAKLLCDFMGYRNSGQFAEKATKYEREAIHSLKKQNM